MRAVHKSKRTNEIDARRIAQNTGWLYVRLCVVTLAGLVSVRMVMNALGVSGFGVYSAVSGAVALIFFLQWTMELTIRRFLCVDIGRGDASGLSETFSAGMLLAAVLCAAFALVGLTAGRWFVVSRMSVDAEYGAAALFVLNAMIVLQTLETLRMPFEALIVASERMSFFAKVSIVEALLSLGAAGAVTLVGRRGLEVYSALLALKSVAVLMICARFCRRSHPGVVALRRVSWARFGEESAFFLKSVLSDVANMFKNQGVNMLINVYAGVPFNASWSMSMRIGSSLYGLVANFQQAFFPQIVRFWGCDDKRPFAVLLAGTLRWSTIIMGVCVLPIVVFTPCVLTLWIGGELPPQAVAFTRCVAVFFFFDALIGPLHTAIVATGKVFAYNVCVSLVMASSFPLAWACLAGGLPAWTSVASVAAVNVLAFLYRLHYVRAHLGVAVLPLLRKAFVPANML